jgi:hypothetical protein
MSYGGDYNQGGGYGGGGGGDDYGRRQQGGGGGYGGDQGGYGGNDVGSCHSRHVPGMIVLMQSVGRREAPSWRRW